MNTNCGLFSETVKSFFLYSRLINILFQRSNDTPIYQFIIYLLKGMYFFWSVYVHIIQTQILIS
jgi:hypothetical protein